MKKSKIHSNNVIFLKVRLNEAEKKYKDIQDKLEKISQETNARAPECMALKTDVTAKKRVYNEAEVREIFPTWNIKYFRSNIKYCPFTFKSRGFVIR